MLMVEKYVMILYERKVNVDGREVCHVMILYERKVNVDGREVCHDIV